MLAMNSGALSRQEPAQVCPMRHPVCHRGLAQVGHGYRTHSPDALMVKRT